MKTIHFFQIIAFMACTTLLTSCSVIADIFKAGMGFGIFLVIIVVVGILVLVSRMGKK